MKKIAFTIVLNGMPFITQQVKTISKMFDKWYIIEGAALPVKDTSWCKQIPDQFHRHGLSVDGTTEYLNEIASDKIVVIRNSNGFWKGKTDMCNSFMHEIEHCLLMQIDVDEFWDERTLESLFKYCDSKPIVPFNGMYFKCNFLVGKNLMVIGNNCYGNKDYEWLRLWIIKNKTEFLTHEPPMVKDAYMNVPKEFTASMGWIFDHYAYTTEQQLKFKEYYYGYTGAVSQWNKLQEVKQFPVRLRDYFPWVNDEALVIQRR